MSRLSTEDIKTGLRLAYRYAKLFSSDPRTKNGAIIKRDNEILGAGANRLPRGVAHLNQRIAQAHKPKWLIHAELDAILSSTRHSPVIYSTMFCPWACCQDCAKAIIQSGISQVVVHRQMLDRTPDHWKESIRVGYTMLREAGVEYICWSGKIGGVTNLFGGEVWYP